MKVDHQVQSYEIERALAKGLGQRCETFVCKPELTRILIGSRWILSLDAHEREYLYDYVSSPSALVEKFDDFKGKCLSFREIKK